MKSLFQIAMKQIIIFLSLVVSMMACGQGKGVKGTDETDFCQIIEKNANYFK